MKKKYLSSKQFKRLITCQPFFVWNELREEKIDNSENKTEHYWNNITKENNDNFSSVLVKTIKKIDDWLINKLSKHYDCFFVTGNSIEEKIKNTKKGLKSNKLIIKPIFEFENCIAKPFAFNSKNNELIYIKYSKKTKIEDMINPYWDFHIIEKITKINKITLFLPESKKHLYKKGQIILKPIQKIHITKTGSLPFEKNAKGEEKDKNILEFIKNPKIKNYIFPTFEEAVEKIKEAKKEKKIYINKIKQDSTPIGKNPYRKEILKNIGFKYYDWNGKIICFKKILEFLEHKNENIFHSKVFLKIKEIKEAYVNQEKIIEIERINESKKIIWYDFEGFSLPFSPMDNVSPYSQIVFQVSLIETIKNKEKKVKNIVLDPLNININYLYSIIENVYSNKADSYVVYNKGYEIKRMEEIIEIMELEKHPKIKEARNMLDYIQENTVDLMNIFQIKNKEKIPPILLNDQFAKSSIKNIEKHISKNKINLPRPIKEYKNLKIQNGMMAMNIAIERAIKIIGNNEWNEMKIKLKEYCENDVRAMIMVYDFVLYLLNKKNNIL